MSNRSTYFQLCNAFVSWNELPLHLVRPCAVLSVFDYAMHILECVLRTKEVGGEEGFCHSFHFILSFSECIVLFVHSIICPDNSLLSSLSVVKRQSFCYLIPPPSHPPPILLNESLRVHSTGLWKSLLLQHAKRTVTGYICNSFVILWEHDICKYMWPTTITRRSL